MKKLIKNYSTEVPIDKTIAEIQKMLGENGALGVMFEYDGAGQIESIYFRIKYQGRDLPFRLPAKPQEVYNQLFANKGQEWKYKTERMLKAKMIAWRVCKLWLEAQLTHVNLGQAKMEEVFLPYMVVNGNLTVYETMVERGMLLPEGKTS